MRSKPNHTVIDRLNVCLGTTHSHVHEDAHSHAHEHDDHLKPDHSHHDQTMLHVHHFHPCFEKEASATTESAISTLVAITSRLIDLWRSAPYAVIAREVSSKITELLHAINQFKDGDVLSILSDSKIGQIQPQLWEIMSAVECQNELREARDFCSKEALSMDQVLQYSFGGDYERLVQKEIECMLQSFPKLHKEVESVSFEFKFVGAGPMPMSAIYINKILKCKVECIDRDPEAAAAGKALISKLGLTEIMPYSCGSSSSDITLLPHQILFVASLVQGKLNILRGVPIDVYYLIFSYFFCCSFFVREWLPFARQMVCSVYSMSLLIESKY
jgi:hypothetical protein